MASGIHLLLNTGNPKNQCTCLLVLGTGNLSTAFTLSMSGYTSTGLLSSYACPESLFPRGAPFLHHVQVECVLPLSCVVHV